MESGGIVMAKEPKKIDRAAHWQRTREARELIERERRRLRERREGGGSERRDS